MALLTGAISGKLTQRLMATILRLPGVQAKTGKGRSATYADIDRGVMVKPIKLGERAVGFPDYEVDAIIKARIAGASEMELRKLVDKLHAQRKEGLQ